MKNERIKLKILNPFSFFFVFWEIPQLMEILSVPFVKITHLNIIIIIIIIIGNYVINNIPTYNATWRQ